MADVDDVKTFDGARCTRDETKNTAAAAAPKPDDLVLFNDDELPDFAAGEVAAPENPPNATPAGAALTVVTDAIVRAAADRGVLFEEIVLDAVLIVREANLADYMRVRDEITRKKLAKAGDFERALKARATVLKRAANRASQGATVTLATNTRVKVDVVGDLDTRSRAIITALDAMNVPPRLFAVGGRLGLIRKRDVAGEKQLRRVLEMPTPDQMLTRIGEVIECVKRGEDNDFNPTEKTVDPERDMATNVVTRSQYPFPVLDGIVRAPFVGQDGSVFGVSGYVAEHRIMLDVGDRTYAIVPHPTRDDVEAAKCLIIDELFGDFPFADGASLANAIAVGITLVTRPIILGPVPMVGVSASKQGTGKSLLLNTITAATAGSGAAVGAEPETNDEMRKRITSTLLDPPAMAIIDNVKHRMCSGALSGMLTATRWSDRVLGKSMNVDIRTTTIWAATGNNLTFDSDMVRRVVPILLQVDDENPAKRSGFRHVLPTWASDNHVSLASAFLTLASYGLQNPSKASVPVFGSFEAWAELVGGLLAACGIDGFLGNLDAIAGADTEGETWRSIVEVWAMTYGDRVIRASELVHTFQSLCPELLAAIVPDERAQGSGLARRVGDQLSSRVGQVWSDWRICEAGKDKHSKVKLFRLKPMPASSAAAIAPAQSAGDADVAADRSAPKATVGAPLAVTQPRDAGVAGVAGDSGTQTWDDWKIFDE